MKQLLIGSLAMFFAFTASAHGCPGEMRAIDAKVPMTVLPAAEMSKVKALREEAEKLHKEGQTFRFDESTGRSQKTFGYLKASGFDAKLVHSLSS